MQIISIKEICSLVTASVPHSLAGVLWAAITSLWPGYCILIGIAVAAWIAFEIATRHGNVHYNSENRFSPTFNRFVGAGTYLGLQALTYLMLQLLFGDPVYCLGWPYVLHVIVFASTGLLLHAIGFWPYLVEPGGRRRWRQRKTR